MRTRIVHFLIGCGMALGLVLAPLAVSAAGNYGLSQTAQRAGYGVGDTVESTVDRVVFTLLSLLAIIFFLLVTYAGLRWMTAQGNEETVTEAKNTLEAAVIGLIVVTAAYAITSFIFRTIDSGGNAPKTPVTTPANNTSGGEDYINPDSDTPTNTQPAACDTGSNSLGTYFCAANSLCVTDLNSSDPWAPAPTNYQSCEGSGQVCCMHKVRECLAGSNNEGAYWCTADGSCDGTSDYITAPMSFQDCGRGEVCCAHDTGR